MIGPRHGNLLGTRWRVGAQPFRFSGGDGYPLSILVQPDRFGFEGAVLSKEDSTGTWSMDRLRIDQKTGGGLDLSMDSEI